MVDGILGAMGILTDYFIAASDAEAARHLDSGVVQQGLPASHVLEFRGIEPYVKLGTLESIVTGRPYAEVSAGDTTVTFSTDTGAVVDRVRPTLLGALLAATDEDLVEFTEAWSRTEEMTANGLGPAELVPFVRGLIQLARTADDEGAQVYCWMSP